MATVLQIVLCILMVFVLCGAVRSLRSMAELIRATAERISEKTES